MDESVCIDMAQVFNASRDLVAIIDLEKNIKNINSSYANFLGVSRAKLIDQPCSHFLKSELCQTKDCPFEQVTEQGKLVELEVLKRDSTGTIVPMLFTATPIKSSSGKLTGMIESFKDISMLKNSENRLRALFSGTIHSMAEIVETRDSYTAGHQQRVANIAEKIAQKMGLSENAQEAVYISSLIHDIGKIYVPLEFLTKPGKLSDIEFEVIKCHAKKGYEILYPIPFEQSVATIVRQHHERIDGSGYPDALQGDMILLEARIIGVADVVEAISSHRPYRPALGLDTAMEEIRKNRGIKYDTDVVDACLSISLVVSSHNLLNLLVVIKSE